MEQPTNPNGISDEDVERRMAEADGVIGEAGHQMTDPVIRDFLRQKIRGEITSTEYKLRAAEHTLGYVSASIREKA